jgi:hypothetical protein
MKRFFVSVLKGRNPDASASFRHRTGSRSTEIRRDALRFGATHKISRNAQSPARGVKSGAA